MGTLLLKSISEGRLRQTGLFLKVGADVNEKDRNGQTELIRAMALTSAQVRANMVKLLTKYSADVSMVDMKKRNAFMWACFHGRSEQVKYMVSELDVNALHIDAQDKDGNTCLLLAVKQGHLETVMELIKILKEFGMQSVITLRNKAASSPILEAFRKGNFDIAKCLIVDGKVKVDDLTNHILYDDEFILEWTKKSPQDMIKQIIENLSEEFDPHPSNILRLLITNESFRRIALKSCYHGQPNKKRIRMSYDQKTLPKTAPGRLQTTDRKLEKPKQKSIKGMLPVIMNLYEEQHCENYRPASKSDFIPYSSVSRQLKTVTSRTSTASTRASRSHLSSLPDFTKFSKLSDGKFTRSIRSSSVQLPQANSWLLLRKKLRNIHDF